MSYRVPTAKPIFEGYIGSQERQNGSFTNLHMPFASVWSIAYTEHETSTLLSQYTTNIDLLRTLTRFTYLGTQYTKNMHGAGENMLRLT